MEQVFSLVELIRVNQMIMVALVALFFIWREYEKKSFNVVLNHKYNVNNFKQSAIQKNIQLSSLSEFKRSEDIQIKKKPRNKFT
ncbi:MAG: hypothetical protein PHY93_09805, partial [Bacteriovorax sp.]|nr:hypothetical protein [Bacteriovorax sp.]